MLAPPRRQIHIPSPSHANRPSRIRPGGCPCWRRPAGKAISHRLATPTGRPESCSAAAHVGAAPPANPYPTAGPRQQSAPNPARRPAMLAPPRRQIHIPPPGHANSPPRIPSGSRPCWRLAAVKALSHRLATPTGHPESGPSAVHVGAAPPVILIPPPSHANRPRPLFRPAAGHVGASPAGKALSHRLATPTDRPLYRPAAAHVGASPPAKPYLTA